MIMNSGLFVSRDDHPPPPVRRSLKVLDLTLTACKPFLGWEIPCFLSLHLVGFSWVYFTIIATLTTILSFAGVLKTIRAERET
jgi:hypothetical protein